MSKDASAQTGPSASGGAQQAPQSETLVRESIKYRRRAQEAERRAEALEAEVNDLRRERDEHAARLEEELVAARAEMQAFEARLIAIDRDRRLERELVQAGCVDMETAMALAGQRLAGQEPPSDLQAFAKRLLEEKPHLHGESSHAGVSAPAQGLPPRTTGVKLAGGNAHRRGLDRMADQARRTGNPKDVMAYMRTRRGV
jgi:hypothetical protein